jgi:hypothetical protein
MGLAFYVGFTKRHLLCREGDDYRYARYGRRYRGWGLTPQHKGEMGMGEIREQEREEEWLEHYRPLFENMKRAGLPEKFIGEMREKVRVGANKPPMLAKIGGEKVKVYKISSEPLPDMDLYLGCDTPEGEHYAVDLYHHITGDVESRVNEIDNLLHQLEGFRKECWRFIDREKNKKITAPLHEEIDRLTDELENIKKHMDC